MFCPPDEPRSHMFDNLREAFREAVENFRTELNRDQVPAAADRLLKAMEGELGQARAEMKRLANEVEETRKKAAEEEEEARTCLRREEMARRIGDTETADLAHSYAQRHLQRKDVLDQKAQVLERELKVQQGEVEEMTERLKEAHLQRDALTASAGRTSAHQRLGEADDLFREMDRMADRIQDLEGRADAARELGEMDLDGQAGTSAPPSDEEMEARLEALKRRMGNK